MPSLKILLTLATVGAAAVGASLVVSADDDGAAATTDTLIQSGTRAVYTPGVPCRLADTRPANQVGPRSTPIGGGETLTIDITTQVGDCDRTQLPLAAEALALNVTAIGATAPTFLTLWPGGDRPDASSLNPVPGAPPTPNGLAVQLSDARTFDVFNAFGDVDVIIDVVGTFEDHHHDDRYYTEAESDGFRTLVVGRLSALESGGSSSGRTIFVGGDGAPATLGANLEAAITTAVAASPTAADPWLIQLDAGVYFTGELTVPAHVHLQGSGIGVSTINGQILATGATTIRSLTIDNPNLSTFRSVTTGDALALDRVEIIGNSGIAVDDGAQVQVTDSVISAGGGPIVTMVGATANADVVVERSTLTNTAAMIIAMEVDGGSLTLRDVTGEFAGQGPTADDVIIERSRLTADGQFAVTNAGSMEVIDSYLERSPATTFRVVSVVGTGAEVRIVNSSVIGGGGGGDDVVGATASCTGVAADAGWFDDTCP